MSQFKSAEKLTDYLRYFRADNIVNDAEFVRKRLVPDSRPWTVLGQVKVFFLFVFSNCVSILVRSRFFFDNLDVPVLCGKP